MALTEATYLVIRRSVAGREYAERVTGPLVGRLAEKDAPRPAYMLRIDRLRPEEQQFWMTKSTQELLSTYHWLRDEGTLPPPNLADPPKPGQKPAGRLLGPDHWWFPPGPPRPPKVPAP